MNMPKTLKVAAVICAAWISLEATGQVGAIARVVREALPLEQIAKNIYRSIARLEPIPVKHSSDATNEVVKSVLRPGVEAIAARNTARAAGTASAGVSLYVKPDVEGADIKIMNIAPTYEDGIVLPPKNYEIEVSKAGYRSKRFWTTIPPEASGSDIEIKINLQKLGLPNCINNVKVSNHGSILSKGGQILQAQASFVSADINDLYLSFSKNIKNANFIYVVDTVANPEYVEIRFLQPTTLRQEDIDANRVVDVDPKRFVLTKIMFEDNGQEVLVTYQGFLPQGILVPKFDKELMCQNVFTF